MILVTGASGFVGKALVSDLCQRGYPVRAAVRSRTGYESLLQLPFPNLSLVTIGEMDENTVWTEALESVDTLIHCAARAHVLKDSQENPGALFQKINHQATLHLAREAAYQGVKRFVFLSSIQVLGNTSQALPFSNQSPLNPQSPYAQSKADAETALLAMKSPMEIVIIRPPLVYGHGVKGNLARLIQLIKKGLPLPLGAVTNRRQFIGINNLTDFICRCAIDPKAANQTFVVADTETLTTTQLIRTLARAIGIKPRLIPVPQKVLNFVFLLTGQSRLSEQLLANMEIDSGHAERLLGWKPPFTMEEQLRNSHKPA